MGGEVSADFTSVITHLIAKEVGSKKYQVATNTGIPVISPSWVRSIWQKSNYDHIAATSEMMIKDHVLPIFKGCTICVTGLDTHQREYNGICRDSAKAHPDCSEKSSDYAAVNRRNPPRSKPLNGSDKSCK